MTSAEFNRARLLADAEWSASVGDPVQWPRVDYLSDQVERDRQKLTESNGAGPAWLVDAADLLAEPDPGPTRWLVEDLIVDRALIAAVGSWKTTKTYGLLEIAIAVVTGREAFGHFEVAEPGPVVFVIEESGRDALWRRLDSLSRGRAIGREELRGLRLAPNVGVKLDDPDWQERLLDVGRFVRPRLFVFDPLARMKAAARDESAQTDTAPLIDFVRLLREESGAAVAFVQHTGHTGSHMRGSSDLESVWESRLSWKKNGGTVELSSEHREAEAGPAFEYRIEWDHETRTIRLAGLEEDMPDDELVAQVGRYLDAHPDASGNEVYKAIGGRKKRVFAAVRAAREVVPGTTGNNPLNRPGSGGGSPTLFRGVGNNPPGVVPGTGPDDDIPLPS